MRRLILTLAVLLGTVAGVSADPVRFGRTPDISPDGKTIVFSWLGDLWLVEATGGKARLLTMHERHDFSPVFSPDGKSIAFASNRHGNYDVFVISADGGRPTRLTFDSADDLPTGWSPDGNHILFSSSRSTDYPARVETYAVPKSGGQPRLVSAYEGREAVWSPKGDVLAYVRGSGTWYRKGYRGSANDDIWLCNADGMNSRPVTQFDGQDNFPMWSADGKFLYYVSERFGTPANLVRQEMKPDLSGPQGEPSPLTSHKDEAVRRARISRDGQSIVYECGADLWLYTFANGQDRKLAIEAFADDKANPEKTATHTSNCSEYALSADEKNIAFVVQGEVFMMPRTGGKAKQLTHHPANDHSLAWSPDSKKIYMISDRGGQEDVWAIEADDPEHPELLKAHRFTAKQMTNTPDTESGLTFSPDGKRVSFLRGGKVHTMNPDGSDIKIVTPSGAVFDYEWSPDSRWLCYAANDASFASELYVIPATGPTAQDPARNITKWATFNGGITWSRSGGHIAFLSTRKGKQASPFVVALHKPATTGAPTPKDPDWEGIHLRVKHPAQLTASECAISGNGSKIAFRSSQDNDLWVASVDGSQVTRLTQGGVKPAQIIWSRFFEGQLTFRDGTGVIRTVNLAAATPAPGPTAPAAVLGSISFSARLTVRQDEVFAEVFEQAWRSLSDSFYDGGFHGADWKRVRDKYRPLVAHCAQREDLYALVYLMLGELNASHLGITGNLPTPEQMTADLGLLYDRTYPGPGLKIAEVLKEGPSDQRGLNLKPGEIILSIDGQMIDGGVDPSKLLNDKSGESVRVVVTTNPGDAKAKRTVEIKPASRQSVGQLHYERWIERNAQKVHEQSKGKLAYIHIPSMDDAGVERFLRGLYSEAADKEGIVLDVRFNGGGFTHETILNYLLGKEHAQFFQRSGAHGYSLNASDRKWTKPVVLLINSRSFSDAEIFPNAFRVHGLGKLVGQPTGAHVIGTRNINLIDGSSFRIPRIGVRTDKGLNMEKAGVEPDVKIDNHPDQLARGEDAQLEKAVGVLTQDVAVWKKNRPGPATTTTASPTPQPSVQSTPERKK
ncbi:MAG: PDZ domain-containing protein [Gemmataceae bacterium]|nr:PDZ domain-containing protein [Gemmataceae bacterium]